ncbi:MAG: peroxiredoxin-like family protein [Parashewanella sp.]
MLQRFFIALVVLLSFNLQAKPIAPSDLEVAPLLNGLTIPNINVQNLAGKHVNLTKVIKQKPTVLFFYRGGWCPYCNAQMGQLQAIQPKLIKMGFQIIGISPDSPEKLNASMTKNELGYQLYSDTNLEASKGFGVAYFTSERMTKRYLASGKIDNQLVATPEGGKRLVLPVPAVYLIDTDGLIHFQYINPNFRVRAEPELLMTAAKLLLKKQNN